MIEDGLVALLKADSTVGPLVGSNINPVALPPSPSYPVIVFDVLPSGTELLLDGSIGSMTEKVRIRSLSTVYADAVALDQAIHALLDTWHGTLPDGTRATVIERATGSDVFIQDARAFGKTAEYVFLF
jgi:hypothetical protein